LHKAVDTLENVLAFHADAFITVSKNRLLTYRNFIPKHIAVIMNAPQDISPFLKRYPLSKSKNHNEFTIVYTGAISRDRGLLLLKNAIKDIDNVRLVLAGRVVDNTIEKLLPDPKIHYIGLVPYEKAIELESRGDVIAILYDPAQPINRVANPNKLFEAMMVGVPVITNVCREIVSETGCGLIVEYDLKSVKEALQYLISHPEVRNKMGENGRKAFEKKYNWNLMEERLLKLYQKLLSS